MSVSRLSNHRRVGLVQMRSGKNADENLELIADMVVKAAGEGCTYVQTPEMSIVLNRARVELLASIHEDEPEGLENPQIIALCEMAKSSSIWLHVGSLAVTAPDEKAFNRSLVISPEGNVVARYDKIHMFDVDLPGGESWRESALYTPGTQAVMCEADGYQLGLGICYDLRFAHLYRQLAKAGAQVLSCPAAFTRQTGRAHWHTLLKARAIENGAFVIAAAQGGDHADGRETYGHSLVVDPWGDIVGELDGEEPGLLVCDLDLSKVDEARARIPALKNDARFAISKING